MDKKKMLRKIEQIGEARNIFRGPLTKKQEQILNFVKLHAEKYGFPPTRQEISSAFGFASRNAAHQHLVAIQRKGRIKMQHAARGIIFLEVPSR